MAFSVFAKHMKPLKTRLLSIFSYFKEINLESRASELNPLLEVNMVNGRLVLDTPNANYSFGGLHRAFQKIFKKLDIGSMTFREILILGYGAGSIASILRKEYNIISRIDGVEHDEVVLSLAEKYFNIDRISDVKLSREDACRFMQSNEKRYDLIIVDIYFDQKVPEKFENIKFLGWLKQALSDKGMIIFNKLSYNEEVSNAAFELRDRFEKVIGNTEMYLVPGGVPNYMLVYRQII